MSSLGKKKDADKALMEAETPQATVPQAEESTGRSRKKKSFGENFVNEDNQAGKQQIKQLSHKILNVMFFEH